MTSWSLILLGDPAAGKTTQARLLTKAYGLRPLEMGKLLRLSKDPQVRKRINSGQLAPTATVRKIMYDFVVRTPPERGILLNGTRMVGEARFLAKLLADCGHKENLVVYLNVPRGEMERRARGRVERLAGRVIRRADDDPAVLRNKKRFHDENLPKVIGFLRQKYPFRRISGVGTPAQVFGRIKSFIDEQVQA